MSFDKYARLALLAAALPLLACSSGLSSTLVTVRPASASSDAGKANTVDFSVENQTDVPINTVYLAESERVEKAGYDSDEPGSTAEGELWGADLLGSALPVGKRTPISVPHPGVWDARAVDRDGRYQHIARLKLGAGGRYILRLGESNWRVYK
jgi:hypothetical protein